MITLIKTGLFQLFETPAETKILKLDQKCFAWVKAVHIGGILVKTENPQEVKNVLSYGRYRLYQVKDEPELADLVHLELLVGQGKWQGYLLTSGLPTGRLWRKRIIPTDELITKSTS